MNAVTFISDLHERSENTLSEPNLLANQYKLHETILNIIKEVSGKVDNHYVVLCGDNINTTLKDDATAIFLLWLSDIKLNCTNLYSVIGNHEFTYKKKGNLFWNIAYGSDFVRPSKFKLYKELLQVEDEFKVGSVAVKLWHYNKEWKPTKFEDVKEVVVASHNAIEFNGMSAQLKDVYVKPVNLESTIQDIEKLKWMFLGHMHTKIGRSKISEEINGAKADFIIENLGSLGRPAAPEFDIDTKRNIPTLYIDETIQSIENHIIELAGKESLCEEEIDKRKEVYQKGKYIKKLKKIDFTTTDVLGDARNLYKSDMEKLIILENASTSDVDMGLEKAITELQSI